MSISRDNSCKKFQANIFNKSKCQNCFKPRELHLLTDEDLNQAKPIYGGWLCLAPEGTDFDNPMQRSRKWQRRFFVLYETGSLRFALDDLPTTLPQGTVNMNLCMNIIDAEQKTGQKNALCIVLPDQEYYIRAESKEVITGWSEQLLVYAQTTKQNKKKKRKVELSTTQEPGPVNVVEGIPEAEKVPDSRSSLWQEELRSRDPVSAWPAADAIPLGSPPPPTGEVTPDGLTSDLRGDEADGVTLATVSQHSLGSSWSGIQGTGRGGIPRCPSPTPSDPFPSGLLPNGSHVSGSASSLDSEGREDAEASRRTSRPRRRNAEKRGRARTLGVQEGAPRSEESRCSVADRRATQEPGDEEGTVEAGGASSRRGRSEARHSRRERGQNMWNMSREQDGTQGSDRLTAPLQTLRRATSLDRRTTESVMTPDLLNFKKGWMVKLDRQKKWQKFWFVLTNHSLRYYKDSIAEEASDMEGEIDLTTCYNVTEYQVQRNYGFQIHTQESVHTLSAMTAGIRRNWIEALMKNIHPSAAPDVASPDGLPKPDVTQAFTAEAGSKKMCTRARRREGRAKTVDCAGFRALPQTQPPQGPAGGPGEVRRGVYEYEAVPCSSLEPGRGAEQPQTVEEEIEQRWLQVERTASREERRVALSPVTSTEPPSGGGADIERRLQAYKREVEELRARLETHHQQQLDQSQQKPEVQLGSALKEEPRVHSPLDFFSLEAESPERGADTGSLPALDLPRKYQETVALLQRQEERKRSMQAQLLSPSSPPETQGPVAKETEGIHMKELNILLQDSEGRLRGLEGLLLDGGPVSVGELARLLGLHGDAESYLPGQEGMLGRTEELKSRATEQPKEVQKLAQEVELLTGKNKALQQRCQEMVNQLNEADREIERLKAQLTSQEARQQSPLVAEEMELLKAQLAEKDAEGRLHPKEATLKCLGLQAKEDCNKEALLRNWECLYPQTEATEAKLSKQKNKLHLAEGACSDLCAQIEELQGKSQECKRDQGGSSAESEVRIQQEELEGDRKSEGGNSAVYGGEEGTKQSSERCDPGANRIQQVAEEIRMKSEALGKLSESRVLRETEPGTQAAPMGCRSCAELRRQIEVLRTKVVHPGSPASGEGIPSTRVLIEGRSAAPLWGDEEQEEDMMSLRMKYEKDLEDLKAACERGFAAMEESHQKAMEGLQQQHQRDLEQERRDRDRLLAEETAATIAAIEAMKNAHQLELERELEKARKANGGAEGADVEEIRRQHEEELVSLQQELQAVSEHYSQKCLECAHLAQALEAEQQALLQCERENEELGAHNQELNNRLATEVTKLRSMTSEDEGETCALIPGKEAYELEVMLRVKESEVQYLKQEVGSLKEELQTTQRDKKFATDKYKDTYTELSIVRAKAERDLALFRDQLQQAHDALGEPFPEELKQSGYDIMKSKSSPDFLKMAATATRSSDRILRSKSLKEGLTNEQRLHLFDKQETKQF
ncbi:hypothetical protein MATL_G00209890 [Megalops atlanticus]|uniref:PH domain-containing protein n=1 Tax=Megalops atlanticus TaxID=7932 RepID=A0A9D3PJF9_MEGAT|nr:hypothetical protein MATL_G00209890 [Megalops atlanticus]